MAKQFVTRTCPHCGVKTMMARRNIGRKVPFSGVYSLCGRCGKPLMIAKDGVLQEVIEKENP